jgi:hypothetical protein
MEISSAFPKKNRKMEIFCLSAVDFEKNKMELSVFYQKKAKYTCTFLLNPLQ